MEIYGMTGLYNISANIGSPGTVKSVYLEKYNGDFYFSFPKPTIETQIEMLDNGTHGDLIANDGIYTIETSLDFLKDGSIHNYTIHVVYSTGYESFSNSPFEIEKHY